MRTVPEASLCPRTKMSGTPSRTAVAASPSSVSKKLSHRSVYFPLMVFLCVGSLIKVWWQWPSNIKTNVKGRRASFERTFYYFTEKGLARTLQVKSCTLGQPTLRIPRCTSLPHKFLNLTETAVQTSVRSIELTTVCKAEGKGGLSFIELLAMSNVAHPRPRSHLNR